MGRVLGPASYGVYSLGWMIVLMVTLIASLGLEHGVVRFGAPLWRNDSEGLSSLVRRCLGLTLVASTGAAVALFLSRDFLASVFDMPDLGPVIGGLSLGLGLVCLLRVTASATRVTQDMSYGVKTEDMVQPATQLLLLAVFFAAGWHLLGAVAATVLSFLVALGLAVVYLRRIGVNVLRKPPSAGLSTGKLLGFSLPTALAGATSVLVAWTDLLLVGFFRSESDTGIYQAASQAAFVFLMIVAATNAIFTPLVARLMAAGKRDEIDALFKVSTLWALYLSLPVFIVFVLAPRIVLGALLGARYLPGAAPLVLLSLGQMTNLASGAVGFLLILSGRQKTWLVASGVALALNVGLNLVLIPRYGLVGAATGTAIALALLFSGGLFLVRRMLAFWPYDGRIYKALLATACSALSVVGLTRWAPVDGIAGLFLLLAGSVLSFALVLALVGLGAEEKEVFADFFARPRRRDAPRQP